jgi:HAD superfamily hydrolase (TIGR01509 family)
VSGSRQQPLAYIFDFDGVLVNTMEDHFRCYRQALEEVGVAIDKQRFYYQAGMTGLEQIAYFADQAGVDVEPEEVYARKKEIWAQDRPTGEPIEANIALLRVLRRASVPVAIASGSSRGSILPMLDAHDIEVDALVTAEDVQCGKPDPELFLLAAERLDVPAENCLVIEDSDVGIQAARAAGMGVFRFYDRNNH